MYQEETLPNPFRWWSQTNKQTSTVRTAGICSLDHTTRVSTKSSALCGDQFIGTFTTNMSGISRGGVVVVVVVVGDSYKPKLARRDALPRLAGRKAGDSSRFGGCNSSTGSIFSGCDRCCEFSSVADS